MDKERKKEILYDYKTRKTQQGVLCFKNAGGGRSYFVITRDAAADINSIVFRLKLGIFPVAALQADYSTAPGAFCICLAAEAPYNEDGSPPSDSALSALLEKLKAAANDNIY